MIFNKSKKAIQRLNEEKIKLDNIQNVLQGNTWKASLKASLTVYLGKDSTLISRLDNLFFTKKAPAGKSYMGGAKIENIYDDTKKNNFKDLIDNSIEYIKSHGLYKNPLKKNILSDLNMVQIIGGSFVVAGVIFNAGNYKGKLDCERQIDKVKNEKSLLKNKYYGTTKANQKLKIENDSLKKLQKNSH
ncbi:hypothetical protein [Flavobacterium sp. Arc2]|uniref:hypothetical protein n=1 Tax=Flavobacterium sp. Arc2 TaxID=3046685 RepID=UPI00352D5D78